MICITYTSGHGTLRPKPKVGDRRTTKKHGLQIRVWSWARDPLTRLPIGMLVHGSRPVFEWVKPHELEKWDEYLLTKGERAEVERVRFAAIQARIVASVVLFGDPSAAPARYQGLT